MEHPDAQAVVVPEYDRKRIKRGIVHFGVGGFYRAHQALYLDELAHLGEDCWGVIGVGLHRSDIGRVLAQQDNLFTVEERGAVQYHARMVGSLLAYLYGPDNPAAVVAALVDPEIKLVTLTITGAGYPVNVASGEFYAEDDDVLSDLQFDAEPRSVFGFIAKALALRRDAGIEPFTVLSCDNVANNGRAAKEAVLGFARHWDQDLADWIEQNVAFPSSMVDRITPITSPKDREEMNRRLKINDGWPVITEQFRQWVIEDRFCNERPPLEKVGVQFVDDVRPYELMKTRLLNGSHCALGYFGLLLGYEETCEAMQDRQLGPFIAALMEEVQPLVGKVEGIDLEQYRAVLTERFSNPSIKDRLERLAGRASVKVPSYVAPSIAEAKAAGLDFHLLALVLAAWMRLLATTPQEVKDPLRVELAALALQEDAAQFLAAVRGLEWLAEDEEICSQVQGAHDELKESGVRSTLASALRSKSARASYPDLRGWQVARENAHARLGRRNAYAVS